MEKNKESKPRIMLMGDSIRMNYAPLVAKILENEAIVVHIEKENGEHTKKTKKKLTKWLNKVNSNSLSIIHFNNGLHDLSWHIIKEKSKVSLDEYEKNLIEIIKIFKKRSPARLIWATITPVHTEKHKTINPTFLVREDLQLEYNRVALKVMKKENINVNDLDSIIRNEGIEKCLLEDGVHMNEHGNKLLAETVADFLRKQF